MKKMTIMFYVIAAFVSEDEIADKIKIIDNYISF